ncbi:MAG: pyridoxal-phosphate dependent enzyme [Thermoproteota archaeon]
MSKVTALKLVQIGSLSVEGDHPTLSDILPAASEILSNWGTTRTVGVSNGKIVDGLDVYFALKLLGARLVPVSEGKSAELYVPLDSLGFYDDINPPPARVFKSTEELLYRNWPTPLVQLRALSVRGYEAWAKLECFNPFSFSVKDRIGWSMVKKYIEANGRPPKLAYEATSTNTGMALAAMAAIHGFKLRAYIPKTIQRVSDVFLKAMGAEVVRIDKSLTVEAIDDVKAEAERDGAVNLDQFYNDANFEVHLRYTAKELDYQVKSARITLRGILGGLGTSGHMSAIAFYFKSAYRGGVKVYGVQPKPGDTIPGIRRVETGMKWVHMVELDGVVDVSLSEAIEAVLKIARRDGILVGLSSGAVAAAFEKLVEKGTLEPGSYILVFPDNGLKYAEQLEAYMEGRHA